MPQKLSERPEELARQFVVDSIRPGEIQGYDPQQDDPQATDFLPITSDWSLRGSYYPFVSIRETDGPTVPNSGNTNYNGLQGDGSGVNQYTVYNILVSAQAVQGGAYLNGVDHTTIVTDIYDEIHHQIQNNTEDAVSEALFTGMTPATITRDTEETDSGNTQTWIQAQGSISMGVIDEP